MNKFGGKICSSKRLLECFGGIAKRKNHSSVTFFNQLLAKQYKIALNATTTTSG